MTTVERGVQTGTYRRGNGVDEPKTERLDGFVDCCCLLDPRHLVISGWAFHPDAPAELSVLVAGAPVPAERVVVVRGQRPDVSRAFQDGSGRSWGYIVTARLDSDVHADATIKLRLGGSKTQRELDVEPRCVSIEEVEQHITSFTEDERDAVDSALRELPGIVRPPEPQKEIHARPPQPELGIKELAAFVRANVEEALLIPGAGVFLRGWLFDAEGAVVSIHARVGGVTGENILHSLGRFARDDVAVEFKHYPSPARPPGILAFIPLDVSAELHTLEILFVTRDGEVARQEVPLKRLHGTPRTVIPRLLTHFVPGTPDALPMLERHLGPAVAAAWTFLRSEPLEPIARDFGRVPERPTYSVIVPLFGRTDFIRHQLAALSQDTETAETEFVYVVDDPDIHGQVARLCRELSPLFGVPLRLVYPGRNLGFAGACNLGVRHSRGRYVVLMNSDVFPDAPGWLGRLARWHRSLDGAGPVAPRLLYPDGTIQHDGIAFRTHPGFDGLVLNEHLGKGLPTWLAEDSRAAAEVPAVSAACVLMLRTQYEAIDGLDEDYVFGDFEDSDLCFKARQAGYRAYVIRDEVLYHLERQSVSMLGDASWRLRVTLYNAWRHQRRWSAELREAVRQGAPMFCGLVPTSGLSE